jgi:hypothetical protein
LGKASAEGSDLYFESGLPPQIGDFSKGRGEVYQTRLAAAQKAQHNDEESEQKRKKAIRMYEYQQRRKQWKRRLVHLKALCIVIVLAYGNYSSLRIWLLRETDHDTSLIVNTKIALIALAVLVWKTLNSELARISQKPLGSQPHEKFAERWGTRTTGRKRPYGANAEVTHPNGMGMTYLYQQSEYNPSVTKRETTAADDLTSDNRQ